VLDCGWFAGRKLSSFSRYFHINANCAGADKQLLSQLRKTTGFPFVNCRKALEQSNNDLKQVTKCTGMCLFVPINNSFKLTQSNVQN